MVSTEKILVIKLGALGDFIQALGPMKAIRVHHPNAHISLMTTKPFVSLAENSKYFDHVFIDERPKIFEFKKWLDLRKKLNGENYSRVYDLQNNDRTSIYFKLFSPKPEWVGVAKGASHRNTSPERTAGLAFYGHVQTLGFAGVKEVSIDDLSWINSDIEQFNLKTNYALIIPGSAPTRPEKRWPAENFSNVCNYFIGQNIQPVLLGTESEKDITTSIKQSCAGAIDLTGQTSLMDIAPLARNAQLVIGNDTGPMHIIAPTGCHTFVLFSKHSNPTRHAPLGHNVHTIQVDDLDELAIETVIESIRQTVQLEPAVKAS